MCPLTRRCLSKGLHPPASQGCMWPGSCLGLAGLHSAQAPQTLSLLQSVQCCGPHLSSVTTASCSRSKFSAEWGAPWGGTPARGTQRSQRMVPELKRCSLGRGRPLRCPTAPTSWAHRERGCCRGLGSQGKLAACELPGGARRRHWVGDVCRDPDSA